MVGITVLDSEGEKLIEQDIDEPEIDLEIHIEYQTNKEQELSLYILNNFQHKEFTVQGEIYKDFPIVFNETDEFEQISLNISLENIETKENDLCILIVGDWSIYTRRFFLRNTKGDFVDHIEMYENKPEIKSNENIDGERRIEKINGEYQLILDVEDTITSDVYREDFNNEQNEEIIYATIVLDANGDIVGEPFYCSSTTGELRVMLNEVSCSDGPVMAVVFPYANKFSMKEFENTYKMALWSSPISVLYLNRD